LSREPWKEPDGGHEAEATYKAKTRAVGAEKVEELVGLFKALPTLKMQSSVRDLLRFQLYTAVRPSEAREATWEEIDLNTQSWTIPRRG
jgi:integrase